MSLAHYTEVTDAWSTCGQDGEYEDGYPEEMLDHVLQRVAGRGLALGVRREGLGQDVRDVHVRRRSLQVHLGFACL